ncbi:uncharacterized protein BJ171DRAFT_583889 [Polychytrium aggregatum]|uniref:uncharacterized protein n=1 Tax=Polychytrium aggregatum TaxID=110093 RepID=UPI0022FF33FE|nr:uncharacterized protein BJ171DRAFT_583889 [Polychytrium aggregatum]KAI9202774.1 hypothetical protein BJ171DRAFT_583889 [Polychytrium aggregatum]
MNVNVDLSFLLQVQTIIAFFGALDFCPLYNVPLFLYRDSTDPLKSFTTLLVLSVLLDSVWFMLHWGDFPRGSYSFVLFLNVLNLLGKPLSIVWALDYLKTRGGDLRWPGVGNLNPGVILGQSSNENSSSGAYERI